MSPKTESVAARGEAETSESADVPAITPEEFPEWFALASQAMEDHEAGDTEVWP